MKNGFTLLTAALVALLGFNNNVWAANREVPMAELCGSCHKAVPGVMMGFLKDISVEARVLQMNFISHQEIIKFNHDTELKNLESFADIGNYSKRGFKVNFIEINDEKLATEISRFDHLSTLNPAEIITKDVLKKIITHQNVKLHDVRPSKKFEKGHLPGAIPMSSPLFEKFGQNLPEDHETPIVFYGNGDCLSYAAFIKAKSFGYNNVGIYAGGYPNWSTTEYVIVDINWLKKAIAAGTPHVLIDLRPTEDIINGHIKGSVTISSTGLAGNRTQFPASKDVPIIFYGPGSKEGATQVISWGYKTVGIIPISFDGWQAVSHLVDRGPAPYLRRN